MSAWLSRMVGGVHRLLRLDRTIIVRMTPSASGFPTPPGGFTLHRVDSGSSVADQELAEAAMQAVGEEAGLASARFAKGDELFGWLADGRIVSFGWVTYRDRVVIGNVPLRAAEGRAFLYNFQTLQVYRGLRLYPALLGSIWKQLNGENVAEFIGEVNARNTSSTRGIEKAGFSLVAELVTVRVLNRWNWLLKRTVRSNATSDLL